jgi:hypothetical protein
MGWPHPLSGQAQGPLQIRLTATLVNLKKLLNTGAFSNRERSLPDCFGGSAPHGAIRASSAAKSAGRGGKRGLASPPRRVETLARQAGISARHGTGGPR